MRIITLLTDFGTRDWFVPSMKGVILNLAPRARIVDLTHEIPPQDVRSGAFVLAASARLFPKGTIHVAVVDPGVGGERKAVTVKTRNFIFIGPDNGALSLALRNEEVMEIRSLENPRLFRQPVSNTFHGRDIFAPVAAHLARGVKLSSIGPRLSRITSLPAAEPSVTKSVVRGEVIYIDRFGNLITNIAAKHLSSRAVIQSSRHLIRGLSTSYSETKRGHAVALINSLNLLEIGVCDGNAAKFLNASVGTPVCITQR